MRQEGKTLSLSPRLSAALSLGKSGFTAADIGCDHGRLTVSLIRSGRFKRVIASDISGPSLSKCRLLCDKLGMKEQVEFRCGSGMHVLSDGEADTVFILGMGGTLIKSILSDASLPLCGAENAVLSPMKGVEDLRRYLYENGYHMADDAIIREDRRLYQIFSVTYTGIKDVLPDGWPEDCFEIGYRAFEKREPLFSELLERRIASHKRSLLIAGESVGKVYLNKKLDSLLNIKKLIQESEL